MEKEVWQIRLKMTLSRAGQLDFAQIKKMDLPCDEFPTAKAAVAKARRVLKKLLPGCVLRLKSVKKVT